MNEGLIENQKERGSAEKPKLIGILANGEHVFDRKESHLHNTEALLQKLPEALLKIKPNGREFFIESVDFQKEIGRSNCVETRVNDHVVYAQRKGRVGMSRFVKNREAEPTSQITVVLQKAREGYIIITAFVGPKAEREPWDPRANQKARAFWEKHALIYGKEEIVPGTETEKCPW